MTDFDSMEMAEALLRHNAFYRLLQRGKPPYIYQEISRLASQSLSVLLLETIQQGPLSEQRFSEISSLLLAKTWQAVLGERQMKAIALHVQSYALGTPEFQTAIDILFRALFLSNRLKKRPDFASDEAYREAQNILQLWICKNIHKFDAERGEFIKWINFRFDRTHIPQATDLKRQERFGKPVQDFDFDRVPSHSSDFTTSNLLDWLKEDYIFRIPNRDKPHITFLDIVLARIKNKTWQDIADQYGFNRLTTPRNFLSNWLDNLLTPVVEGQSKSTLHAIRFSRFEGESWENIAQKFKIDEAKLESDHRSRVKRFPSYRDVTRNERYKIVMPDYPSITFSELTKILLDAGHLWQIPSDALKVDPTKLRSFYERSMMVLWPQTFSDRNPELNSVRNPE